LKALGVGWQKGIRWTDIEIRNTPSGQPRVSLSGRCRQIAEELGLNEVLISISHTATYAIASAVGCHKR